MTRQHRQRDQPTVTEETKPNGDRQTEGDLEDRSQLSPKYTYVQWHRKKKSEFMPPTYQNFLRNKIEASPEN